MWVAIAVFSMLLLVVTLACALHRAVRTEQRIQSIQQSFHTERSESTEPRTKHAAGYSGLEEAG
jgi:hypothetical protein